MIPLGDSSRRPINFPIMTAAIIAVNAFVFVLELLGGDAFINYWSLVPANIMTTYGLITVFTSMFMHAGWEHILGNMLFFWVFGPEIEDVMGSLPFLISYLLGGVTATVAQVWIDPTSTIPNLGASGAIAAVMGAFLITYPRDRIRTVVLLGWFARVTFLPAIVMVGLWFLTQLFSEVGALAQVQADSSGVAYMAHIGGFIFGMLVCRLFESRRRRSLQALED
ncbi:MAG TPA: rhomboid family intramembrane serine protease [Anaerolineales bacterium]|nr:rhomboid family intramembrane serine protease [Anaerolineales bacterium]